MRLQFRRKYQHLNKIRISKEALIHNHNLLKELNPNQEICPVLKGNAYGHVLKTISPILDQLKCKFLIVDSLYEAYELKKMRIKTPILIMGYTNPENYKIKLLPFHIAVFDIETAKVLNVYQPNCNIHVFVDTGMSREGVTLEELPDFLEELKNLKNLRVEGLCSHLADSDNNQVFTELQIKNFKAALKTLNDFGFNPKWIHIAASSGALSIKDDTFNVIRGGILHYGINPKETNQRKSDSEKNRDNSLVITWKPALEFTSTLATIKKIKKDTYIGYGCTYKAQKDMILGLLPAGYYEGVDRRLSNKGFVKIRNTFCPIVGRVSMNMTTIDITKIATPLIGEEVIIYSRNPKDINSIENAAKTAETIPYDLLVHLAESVRRELV